MPKENNCHCVVCEIERSLLNSLSTQTARTQFQALAHNYPILNHFDSPADVIARLHQHERVELVNHEAWNGILHALIDCIADRTGDEIGQQLLLLAYAPAIHKVYREVCQKFPSLSPEDIAQQAALCFLETARSPEIQSLNGHLPAALGRRFRQSLFRWAMREKRQSLPLQQGFADHDEPASSNFEQAAMLENFLQEMQRDGLLSSTECELLLKLKCEGFEAKEVAEALGADPLNTHRRLHRKLQTILNRLQRAAQNRSFQTGRGRRQPKDNTDKQISSEAVNFSEEMCTRNSEKGNSPELTGSGTQRKPEVPPIAAW
jgi:DNA-directed RNA polymerase specialized sigma24 family protein